MVSPGKQHRCGRELAQCALRKQSALSMWGRISGNHRGRAPVAGNKDRPQRPGFCGKRASQFAELGEAVAIGPNRSHIRNGYPTKRTTAPSSGFPLGACPGGNIQCSRQSNFAQKRQKSAKSLTQTSVPSEIRELQRSIASLHALAENEDWLSNNFNKIVHAQGATARGSRGRKSLVPVRASPTSRNAFFAASARPSSCNGIRSQRSSSASCSTPRARWGMC